MNADAIATTMRVLAESAEGLAFLTPIAPLDEPAAAAFALRIAVDFEGHARGRIVLALGVGMPHRLAAMLGADPDEVVALEAAKEMANVVAGALLSALHGPEAEFRLGTPHPLRAEADARLDGGLVCEEGLLALGVEDAA